MTNSITKLILKSVLFSTLIFFQFSCSKDDPAPAVVTACFEDSFNGVYNGVDGNVQGDVTVKFTKTSCTSATLESVALGNKIVKEITSSGAGGGYTGKLDNGSAVSIALTNSNLSVTCEGYNFTGSK